MCWSHCGGQFQNFSHKFPKIPAIYTWQRTSCQRLYLLFVFSKQRCYFAPSPPTCVTALIFAHQSWAPNWYRPSLITALHCKSFTALCSLFILFCHSAHQKCRSDMSVMVHLKSRAWMTACVAFPLWNPLRDAAGENVLGTTLYHKSWKHSYSLCL